MKRRENLTEYSKRVIRLLIILWFIGAGFGGAVVLAELIAVIAGDSAYTATVHLPELLNYISAPMTCGIVGYLLKAGFENREKIRKNGTVSTEDERSMNYERRI